MESEKAKEIKKVLEEGQFNTIKHHQKEGNPIKISFADILTLINELESQNKRLNKALVDNLEAYKDGFNEGAGLKKRVDDKLKTENQQLKDRIAELEKENQSLKESIEYGNEVCKECQSDKDKCKKWKLKQFAERLKEKGQKAFINVGGITASAKTVILHDIDETLKEFIDDRPLP